MSLAASTLIAAVLSVTASEAPVSVPDPVVALVRVPRPWYAPQALVARRMRDTQAQYAALPGLRFKAYSFERETGAFGGVYWWADRAAAQAWFNPAWHARVQRERGVNGDVLLLDAPLSVDGPGGAPDADADSPAVATLVQGPWPKGASREGLLALMTRSLPTYRQVPGLLRKHFVLDAASGTLGGVYLWKDEASARAWFSETWAAQARQLYGTAPRLTWFDTPILLPGRDAVTNVATSP